MNYRGYTPKGGMTKEAFDLIMGGKIAAQEEEAEKEMMRLQDPNYVKGLSASERKARMRKLFVGMGPPLAISAGLPMR